MGWAKVRIILIFVENNFLSPDERDVRDKALEDQKAGRNLKEASQNIIYLSDKDAYTDKLVTLYNKGELDKKGQAELAEYLDAVGIQLQLRGMSESDAKILIENILNYPGGYKDTRSAYYEALGHLSAEERHAWQAAIGTDILLAGPGRTSQLMRLALIPGGLNQIEKGIDQIADGKFAEGGINVGLGGLIVSGSYLGNKVTGKPNVKPDGMTPKNSETYFRVEGGGSGTKTSQNRINVNTDGSVTINSGCSGQLSVSTNGPNHASYYLTNKRSDGSVVVFEVDANLHKTIMDAAIPQRPIPGIPKNPNAPKIVDPGKGDPSISLELPKVWDKLIEQNSSKARVLTKEEFLNEFGK